MPMESRRFPQVALDSSMARIPRPGEAILCCSTTRKHVTSNPGNSAYTILETFIHRLAAVRLHHPLSMPLRLYGMQSISSRPWIRELAYTPHTQMPASAPISKP